MIYEFDQNNSGGSFDIDPERGIGPRVYIEADSADEANERAQEIGLYFDGVEEGLDCPCCGDRWYPAWREDGVDAVPITEYTFYWCDEIYLHKKDGTIQTIRKGGA